MFKRTIVLTLAWLSLNSFFMPATSQAAESEWTLLVFLNGFNNLDDFGSQDLNEMEKIGSTAKVNIVVQWASLKTKKVKRLLVTKDNDALKVSSPILEDLGQVDMGDSRVFVDFVAWGHKNFPAKHYFVDMWNHGNGWHKRLASGNPHIDDISYDDLSGNAITTEALGTAMREIRQIIGKNVSLYGSDACLMAMAEIADEMSDSVDFFAGSEHLEPGPGWPYDNLLDRWNQSATATPAEVATILTEEYVKSYQNGSQGKAEVTFSVMDLSKLGAFNASIKGLGDHFRSFDAADRKKVIDASRRAQYFTYADYRDVVDFTKVIDAAGISRLDKTLTQAVVSASRDLVIANIGTPTWAKAHGVAFWFPGTKASFDAYWARYKGLKFEANSGWGTTLLTLFK